uniref:RNA-directed RNA polymerase n=1 Tax=Apple tombus-like virus 2 TaxID=2709738 RepID=A0A6C0X1J4_9TOMB|nr:MAG: RNA-dependent RNA polymerase [Apple tombus-like virus 2]
MSPPRHIYAFNSSLVNLIKGVKERVFYAKDKETGEFRPAPQAVPGVFQLRLGSLRDSVVACCSRLRPLEREEYPLQYTGKKRATYTRALQSLYSRVVVAKDFSVTIFTKTERTLKDGAVPRIVSPMSPEANLETGRFLKPMEAPLCKAIAKVAGHTVVLKGMNAAQVGQTLSENWEAMGGTGNCVAVGIDAERFDRSVGVQALEFEHTHYPPLLVCPADRSYVKWLLGWQLNATCFGRTREGTVKYKLKGTRLSGVINTGMGNCILASECCIAYCREKKIPFRLANNGDDCVFFIRKCDLSVFSAGLKEWFLEMGFIMAVEPPAYELEEVVFCQSQPVFDGRSWTMVRNPFTALAKDCVSLKPWRNAKEYCSWIKGVGLSGKALAGGIPVFHEFYESFLRAGGNAKPLSHDDPSIGGGLYIASKGMTRQNLSVSTIARWSFWKAFGVTPDMQIEIEKHYRNSTPNYTPVTECGMALPTMPIQLL